MSNDNILTKEDRWIIIITKVNKPYIVRIIRWLTRLITDISSTDIIFTNIDIGLSELYVIGSWINRVM